MGKRGPQKRLTALQHLDNNPSKKRVLDDYCGIEGIGEPFISDHLTNDAKGCIMAIMSSMPSGVYRKMDSFLLAAYGMAWAIHKRASEEISSPDFEFIVRHPMTGNQIVSPWLKILNTQAQVLAAVGGRLGLDPTSRQALQLPEQLKQSKFHGLIGPALIEQPASSRSSRS